MGRLPSSDTGSFPLAPCSNVSHCNATAIQLLSVGCRVVGLERTGQVQEKAMVIIAKVG